MRYLALDIGTRRTGVAFLDTATGIPLPLDTVHHSTDEELSVAVMDIIRLRNVGKVLVGLPLLPSGKEGSQAVVSRRAGNMLSSQGIEVEYMDERYSSPRRLGHKYAIPVKKFDGDAAAACALASLKLSH